MTDGEHDREVTWLRRARDLAHALADVRDASALLPRILEAALELAGAERGLLVRVKDPANPTSVRVEASRGFDARALREGPPLSRSVVQRVLERDGRGLVTTSAEDADLAGATSLQGRGVTCVACVPMRLRGQTRGVLYLDHRHDPAAFREADLPALRAFADVAALALDTAEADPPLPPLPALHRFGALVGGSAGMRAAYAAIERCARTWDPVLVVGETGTGRRLAARELHRRGGAPDAPCLEVQAGQATDDEALVGPHGALVRAGRGTVILARPEALAPPLQLRLLAALDERALRGRALECRLVALAGPDLRERVAAGALRADLFYRLDVLRVALPPLRERPDDLPLLLAELGQRVAGRPLTATPEALALLARHAWPGNVRELENEVRRLATIDLPRIPPAALSPELQAAAAAPRVVAGRLEDLERDAVRAALEACGGNKARAAERLGVSRSSLYRLLERHGLA